MDTGAPYFSKPCKKSADEFTEWTQERHISNNNVKSQLFDPELINLQSLKTKGLDFNWYRKPQKKQLQIYIQ